MRNLNRLFRPLMPLALLSLLAPNVVQAVQKEYPQSERGLPQELKDVGITEHLGSTLNFQDLSFKDETGKDVKLAQYFTGKKPVILSLVYYECPNLCTFVLNGLVNSLKPLKQFDWVPGRQFDIVTVSINPNDTPELAAKKKAAYLASYTATANDEASAKSAQEGWHFLTGQEKQINQLASQVGFNFKYDQKEQQYAHSAAIYVLTPEGKISRYMYGIEFKPSDLRLAVLEASNGRVGNIVDRILMFCYHYDPQNRKYSVYAFNLMRAGGAGTVLVFGGYLAVFWNRQRRRFKKGVGL